MGQWPETSAYKIQTPGESSIRKNTTFRTRRKFEIKISLNTNLIFMDPCIVVWLRKNTNKMQPCNRIYYSKVYWRLNMFRAANRSSSGALNCICSLWFIHTCGDRPLSRPLSHSALTTAGHHMRGGWSVVGRAWSAQHDQQRSSSFSPTVQPEAPSAVVCSWWWAERHPKHVEPHINVK
jgi:hypothetical protein